MEPWIKRLAMEAGFKVTYPEGELVSPDLTRLCGPELEKFAQLIKKKYNNDKENASEEVVNQQLIWYNTIIELIDHHRRRGKVDLDLTLLEHLKNYPQ